MKKTTFIYHPCNYIKKNDRNKTKFAPIVKLQRINLDIDYFSFAFSTLIISTVIAARS